MFNKDNVDKELSEFLNISIEEVKKRRGEGKFDRDWNNANLKTKKEATEFYGKAECLLFRQTMPRPRKQVLYRRILKDILSTTKSDDEFRGKNFPDYTKQKVLDYGCGCGDIGLVLASAGYDVDFLEVGGFFEKFIKWRLDKRYLDGKYINYGKYLGKDVYDAIICYDVLEHHENPRQCLKDIHKALKTGGYLFIEYGWHERIEYQILGDQNADSEFIVPFLDEKFIGEDGGKRFWFIKK